MDLLAEKIADGASRVVVPKAGEVHRLWHEFTIHCAS